MDDAADDFGQEVVRSQVCCMSGNTFRVRKYVSCPILCPSRKQSAPLSVDLLVGALFQGLQLLCLLGESRVIAPGKGDVCVPRCPTTHTG